MSEERLRHLPYLVLEEAQLHRLEIIGGPLVMEGEWGPFEVLPVRDASGEHLLPLKAVLKRKVGELKLQAGEVVGIANMGMVNGKYYNYAVFRWEKGDESLSNPPSQDMLEAAAKMLGGQS